MGLEPAKDPGSKPVPSSNWGTGAGQLAYKKSRLRGVLRTDGLFFKWGEADPVKLIRTVIVAVQERNSN